MRALLGDVSLVEYDDVVCFTQRRDPVGDEDRRTLRHDAPQMPEDRLLCLRIDGGQGVVEDEDLRSQQQCPRQGRALLLAPRKRDAAFADDRGEAVFEVFHIGPDLRLSSMHDHARVQAVCESDDLIHWSSPRVYLYPDGEDAKVDGLWGIYESNGFPYESMWLNFLSMTCYHPPTKEVVEARPGMPWIKRNWVRLAASRDGRNYYYIGRRQPFIDRGPPESWKSSYLRMVNRDTISGPVVKGDELWFYYRGSMIDGPKSAWTHGLGLAILRRDGFASLEAGENEGMLITRPLVFEGTGRLFVNAQVAHGGCIRAAALTEEGNEIDGFGRDDCQPVTRDATGSRIGWGRHETLAELKDRYIRLAFHLQDAGLYAFWIE